MSDNKKVKSLVTVNWTSFDNSSEPFYQAASGSHPDRYSVTIVSKYETTGGPHLQERMDEAKEPGLSRILKYYSKVGNDKLHEDVITEDYYVSSRPKAKMKILISLPCSVLDGLEVQTKQKNLDSLGPVTNQIDLNTYDLGEKVEAAVSLINKYSAEINQFYGRIYGIDFTEETTSLQGFIPALSTFMADNNINYSRSNSDLVSLYINDDYKVLMSKVNQGTGYVDLIKGYENFVENDSVNNDRTIFFLSKLDEMQKLAIQNTPLSWSKFLKEYVYRTPEIDFSQPPPRSYWTKKPVHDKIMKEQRAKVQSKEEVENFRFFLNTPEARQEIQAQLDVANSFVGDTVLANLNSLSSKTREIEAMYNEFFDKLGLNGLISSAIQCLDLPRIGVFDVPTDVLDTLTEATKTIQSIFDPPNISLPSDYPIADFMLDLLENIIETIVTTVIQALWQLLIEIIKSLFDFCNDCAGAGGSEVNFGGQGITELIGKSIAANVAASGPSIVLGSFYSAVQDNAIGDAELLAQTVLKNTIKSREKIYALEAEQVFQKYQSGEMSKPNRLALEKKVEEAFLGNVFQQELQDIVGGRVTEERIKILLEKDEPWERTEVFKSASDEITEYLETVSTVLTPSEVGNALLGCNLGDEPKQAMRNVLPQFPNLQLVLSGMSPKDTDDNISRFMGGFSSILPEKSIVDNLAATLNTIPEKFDCLCDADDSALREQILSKKDPEMTPQQVKEQVAKSKQRKKQRITEFANMLNSDNILDGVSPPLVCSGTYDENGNAIITRGVLPVSHPVTQLMINQTIDTVYDPLHTTFSRDLQGMIPAFSQRPLRHEEIDRTVELEVDGEQIRILNPSFVDMVNKGMASWGSLPNGAAIPGSKKPKDADFDPEEPGDEYLEGTEIKEYNRFIGFFDSDYLNPYGAGMWDEGQSRPTPEQEHEWERVNKLYNTGGRTISNTAESAEVILETNGVSSTRTVEFGERYNSRGNTVPATISDYAKAFGESPIPVKDYKFGELDYAPGLKNSYTNMCKNLNTSNSIVSTDIFKIQPKPDHTKTDYSFKMPNLFKSYGVDFDKIADNVSKLSGELSLGGVNRTINGDSLGQIANQLKTLAASELNFVYSPNNNDGTSNLQKDQFSLDLNILSTPANNSNGAAQKLDSAINFSGPPTATQINSKAVKVIESKELASTRKPADTSKPVQPQEGYFYDFAKDAMINANTVYRNGRPIKRERNGSVPPSLQDGFLDSTEENAYVNFLYDEETYKNIFVDLFCAFTNQISESPYFNLKPDDLGRGLKSVNLTPTRIVGNNALCYRTLLDVDLIKDRIFDEYEYVKCFKDAFGLNNVDFDPTGLFGNRNSAFEVSNRAGCILLTIRLYVVEYLLRSISTFHYFTLGNGADIDATSVYYLYHQIVDGLISRSVGTEYYRAFQKETIELYNRNNQTSKLSLEYEVRDHPQVPEYKLYVYKDFRTALEYFIKNQMASVSRRLSKHVKLKGDGSPHSILIEKWLPTVEPPQEEGEIRFADPVTLENKTLGNYMEVADIPELSGDILAALGPNGTLTKKKIEFIRGTPSPTGGFSGMLYEYPTGYFFREYFGLNPTNDKSLQTPALEGKNYKETRSAMDRANNALWPSSVWSDIGWIKTGNPSLRPVQAWREAINLGYDKSPYYATSLEMHPTEDNNTMGNMGLAGFPYDSAANVFPTKTITPGKTVKQGAFPFGVSQAEKEGMIGNNGGLLRFFEAAKNWTLGPIRYGPRPFGNNPRDQGNQVGVAWGIESEEGTLRTKNPEYCLWRPNNLPWWWDEDYHQPSSVTSEANRAAFLQSARYYGPGSLLWSMTKEREATNNVFGYGRNQGGRSNGVGAFGIVNDLQTRGSDRAGSVDWPEEYKRIVPTIDGRTIPGQTYKTNSFNGYLIPFLVDWHNYVLGKAGTPGVLPDQPDFTECGTCGWTRNTESALRRLELNEIPYISLMDLDVTAIVKTLEWEKKQYEDFIADINLILTKAGYALSGTGPQQYGNPTESEKIDALLGNVDSSELSSFCLKVLKNAYDSLVARNGPPVRIRNIRTALEAFAKQDFVANKELYREVIGKYESDWIPEMRKIKKDFELAEEQRNCMVEPTKAIAANGREKRNDMLVPPTLDVSNGNIILEPYIRVEDYGRTENLELILNKEYIEINRDDSTRGVVNIDKFDKFMKEKFEGQLNTLPVIKPATSIEEQQSLFQEDCGTGLPSRREASPENTTQSQNHQLRDYFKNLHFGLRVSLLSKPEPFSNPLKRPEDFVDGGDRTNAKLEKTYYMKEQKGTQERNIYLTPLTSVEIPIGMLTDIESLFPEGGFSIISPEKLAEQVCGQASPTEQDQVQKVGYFRYLFSQPKQRDGEVVPLSSPQNVLQRQMQETDDYALLFKYIFSLDRMLSLTNLYSASYLSTLPDINNLFAPSKESVMYIFLNSLRSGKWADACQTGNKDLLDALQNGITPPWAALLNLTLKFPLKIFKAYIEQTDINIAISQNIKKGIQMMNSIIANSQRQLNALNQAGAAAIAQGESLLGTEISTTECGFGIHSPESTRKPPNDWFNPVRETFIYEPETWMIGLALLPATLFAPWLWGPPVGTTPGGWPGVLYWALDDSNFNWLDSYIDDFTQQLANNPDPDYNEQIDEPCDIDYQLEFGIGDDMANNNNNGSGNGGGSTY